MPNLLSESRNPQARGKAGRHRTVRSGPGELQILREIRRRAGVPSPAALPVGIGDDCAVIRPRAGEDLAVTTDLSIAGRHFRLEWHLPEAVGRRVLVRGLSDLAAMGARPLAAFLSLGLPRELTLGSPSHGVKPRRGSWLEGFLDGFFSFAAEHKTPLAGGDLAESPIAAADIVLIGAVPRGRALLRSGARPGDAIYVTGTLGGAAAALARLARLAQPAAPSRSPKATGFGLARAREKSEFLKGMGFSPYITAVQRKRALAPEGRVDFRRALNQRSAELAPHLYPQPRLAQGQWLARRRLATAAIDISDGLSTDLAHICEESDVAAEIDASALPIWPGAGSGSGLAATLDQALHGGEDYELLFTARPSARLPRAIAGVPVTRIGRILRARKGLPRMTLLTAQGPRRLEARGWRHFA